MTKNYIILLFTILILSSCGKSKQEMELEKAKLELEKTKLELAENKKNEKLAEIQRIHEQKTNVGKRKKITELQMQLNRLPNAIEKAQQNIDDINEFQFGRASSTKEKQLNKAYKELEEIQSYGNKLKNEIAQLEYRKTFEFQKSPEGVMNYIFQSAKNGDFSNFRYLCDPYGENDADVNQICYVEMLTDKRKVSFKQEFENGRIIGDLKITSENAEIEFAYGRSSNKLEKMRLIKRNGLWYLSGY